MEYTTEQLVGFINDNIDDHTFPCGQINSVNDAESWDKLGEYLGGFGLMQTLKNNPRPRYARWYQYEECGNRIYWYTNQADIIKTVGLDTLYSWYERI